MSELNEFVEEVVKLNVEEALQQPANKRSVFNACASLEAAGSALYWFCIDKELIAEQNDGKFKTCLGKMNDAFRIIHDVAEAQKHNRLTYGASRQRTLQRAEQVKLEAHGWGHARWDELILGVDAALSLIVENEVRTVASCAHKALGFIKGEIWMAENGDARGIIAMEPSFEPTHRRR